MSKPNRGAILIKRYYSKLEYGRMSNLCPHSVRELVNSGKLKTEKIGSREKIVIRLWYTETHLAPNISTDLPDTY